MPIFMKDGEIHVSICVGGPAGRPDGVEDEAGSGKILALHEATRRFRPAPTQGRVLPEEEAG